jgi:hypothetical protein
MTKPPSSETDEICRYVVWLAGISGKRARVLSDYIRFLLEPPQVRGRFANPATRRAQIIADIETGGALDKIMAKQRIGLLPACGRLAELRGLDDADALRKAYYRYRKSPGYRQGWKARDFPPVSSLVRNKNKR